MPETRSSGIVRRRILFSVLALTAFGLLGRGGWVLLDLPPPGPILQYGLDPRAWPTGRTRVVEGIEFIEIAPGISWMGSNELGQEPDWLGRLGKVVGLEIGRRGVVSMEMPTHWVDLPRAFWVARTELTNEQFERFRPGRSRPAASDRNSGPAVGVTWSDATEYCAWLSELTGVEMRLPSEAEWECVCRTGRKGRFGHGDDEATLGEYAWFSGNSRSKAHPTATKLPNAWGFYDLHGNAREWCEDSWSRDYQELVREGTVNAGGDARLRVYRGGGWCDDASDCRSAVRGSKHTRYKLPYYGFRVAFSTDDATED